MPCKTKNIYCLALYKKCCQFLFQIIYFFIVITVHCLVALSRERKLHKGRDVVLVHQCIPSTGSGAWLMVAAH